MIDTIELLMDVQEIIKELKAGNKKSVLTTDIIRKHQGNYYNANTSPQKSWNSRFGQFLKKRQQLLGIEEVRKDVNVKDDNGKPTSCSEWKIK